MQETYVLQSLFCLDYASPARELPLLLAQNKKLLAQNQQLRGKNATPSAPRAHEEHVTFEGAEVSLISLTRMLEVEEQTRGYKQHPRYSQLQTAIERCWRKRDAPMLATR